MSASCNDILVVVECSAGKVIHLTYELLGLGRRLVDERGGKLIAATLESSFSSGIAELGKRGADQVYCFDSQDADVYEVDQWLQAIPKVLAEHGPAHVLVGHTSLGSELGPRLAFRLDSAIATGCESVELKDGRLSVLRPCFGSKAREGLTLQKSPGVATVLARAYDALSPSPRDTEVISIELPHNGGRPTTVLNRTADSDSGAARLETARIVVAGGRGLGGPEGFEVLQEFASAIGGAVGASRVAVDLGWCPHSWQIGLSGRTVTPELYVAVGISGASHHMAGCGKSKAVLAINSDPEAAIFKEATFGVVGDYRDIIPALVAEFRQ